VILTRVPDGLLVVRQPDHGTQTGLFAAEWGNETVAPMPAHDTDVDPAAVELAASHHDDGWAVWERRPTLDPHTHQPVQFLALTPLEHVPLYQAGIARAAQHNPWTGLLVSMHGAGLYNDRYGTFRLAEQHFSPDERALVDEFLSDMAELQTTLLGRTGHRPVPAPDGPAGSTVHASDDPLVRQLYLLLQVWDRLSLQYVFWLAGDGVIAPAPGISELRCAHDGPFALILDPYPFTHDGAVFPAEARLVTDRPYRSPEDFLAELAGTDPTTIECTARAGPVIARS
jgi:hypothetical protein